MCGNYDRRFFSLSLAGYSAGEAARALEILGVQEKPSLLIIEGINARAQSVQFYASESFAVAVKKHFANAITAFDYVMVGEAGHEVVPNSYAVYFRYADKDSDFYAHEIRKLAEDKGFTDVAVPQENIGTMIWIKAPKAFIDVLEETYPGNAEGAIKFFAVPEAAPLPIIDGITPQERRRLEGYDYCLARLTMIFNQNAARLRHGLPQIDAQAYELLQAREKIETEMPGIGEVMYNFSQTGKVDPAIHRQAEGYAQAEKVVSWALKTPEVEACLDSAFFKDTLRRQKSTRGFLAHLLK